MSYPSRRALLGAALATGLGAEILAGCAAQKAQPSDRPTPPSIPQGMARLVVYFPSSWTLLNHYRRVEVDAVQYGEIGMGEFMTMDIAPGARQLRLWRAETFPGGPPERFVRPFQASAGSATYFRFVTRAGAGGGGFNTIATSVSLDRVPETVALEQTKGMEAIQQGLDHSTPNAKGRDKRQSRAASVPAGPAQ